MRWRHLAIAGLLLAILGSKILLVALFASPAPYWDQWDAEAAGLYLPYLTDTLTRAKWFAFHNEHRIVLTRATALTLLRLDGSWDPIAQMLFNAVLHVASIGVLVVLLGRLLIDRASLLLFVVFAAMLFVVPFGYDNTLAGFQAQFYGLILISVVALYLTSHAHAFTPRWIAGTLIATVGYLAMASGALILPAAISLAAVQYAMGLRRGARELSGIAVHAAITAALIADTLMFAPGEQDRGHSIGTIADSFLIAASWPIAAKSWPTVLRIIPAALMYAPLIVFAIRFLRARNPIEDRRWFVLALGAWLAGQTFALAYGRLGAQSESRYFDIFLIGIALNATTWLYLLHSDIRASKPMVALAAVWLFAVMLGAGQKAINNVPDGIAMRYRTGQAHTLNIRNFITTGDPVHLAGKPVDDIPFPSGERLRELLSDPKLRAILPPALTGAPEPKGLKTILLAQGRMLLPLGLALLLFTALATWWRRDGSSADPT